MNRREDIFDAWDWRVARGGSRGTIVLQKPVRNVCGMPAG